MLGWNTCWGGVTYTIGEDDPAPVSSALLKCTTPRKTPLSSASQEHSSAIIGTTGLLSGAKASNSDFVIGLMPRRPLVGVGAPALNLRTRIADGRTSRSRTSRQRGLTESAHSCGSNRSSHTSSTRGRTHLWLCGLSPSCFPWFINNSRTSLTVMPSDCGALTTFGRGLLRFPPIARRPTSGLSPYR